MGQHQSHPEEIPNHKKNRRGSLSTNNNNNPSISVNNTNNTNNTNNNFNNNSIGNARQGRASVSFMGLGALQGFGRGGASSSSTTTTTTTTTTMTSLSKENSGNSLLTPPSSGSQSTIGANQKHSSRTSTGIIRRISFARLDKQSSSSSSQHGKPLKVLILGAEDSGKSSWLKAMKSASGTTWSQEELDNFRNIIYSNILLLFYRTIKYCRHCGLLPMKSSADYASVEEEKIQRIERICEGDMTLHTRASIYYDKQVSDTVCKLFQVPFFRNCLIERARHTEGISKFLTQRSLERLCPPDYVPSDMDILQSYKPTGGVDISKLKLDHFHVKIFDLSGHKTEQSRWHHNSNDVDALFYFASLSEYNKNLSVGGGSGVVMSAVSASSPSWSSLPTSPVSSSSGSSLTASPTSPSATPSEMNMMKDSLDVFEQTLRQIGFGQKKIKFILVLNKKDVFLEKFNAEQLKQQFSAYSGSTDPNDAIDFISGLYQKRFDQVRSKAHSKKKLHVLVSSIIDPEDVRNVFERTKIILAEKR